MVLPTNCSIKVAMDYLDTYNYYTSPLSGVGMTVRFAYYGATCTNGPDSKVEYTSTKWVKSLCEGKTSCSGTVSTDVLTDPYPGCQKNFIAFAKCPDGHFIRDSLSKEAQGKTFHLQC